MTRDERNERVILSESATVLGGRFEGSTSFGRKKRSAQDDIRGKMLHDYFGILVMFVFAGLFSALFIVLAQTLGPKKPNPAKAMPYECGEPPFEAPSGRHAVKFYLAGMLFVLFDVELIFFFPWAVLYRSLGFFGLAEMMFFMLILVLGFVYAWRKGALEWK